MYPILIRNISTLQVWYDSYTPVYVHRYYTFMYTYMYVHVVYRYHMCVVHMHVPRYDVMYVLVYVQ